jgi:DNA-directed RNA polymerase beta subunit
MPNPRYFISDFVEIQRKSFFQLLEKGIIEEFTKRNPITSLKKDIELFFYPEYYKLTIPEFSPRQAIIKSKSYTSKLYIPVQLTYKKSNIIRLKWAYIGNLPLMTKRGHFILNGAARVIVNQIIRSPGIYYQEKLHETFSQKWSQKPEASYKRYYADLICLRGTWLRLEIDKDKNIWAQTKKGPKIPVFWFLIAMGLSERVIFNSVLEPNRLVQNLGSCIFPLPRTPAYSTIPPTPDPKGSGGPPEKKGRMQGVGVKKNSYCYVKNPPSAWKEIFTLLQKKNYINENVNAFSSGTSTEINGPAPGWSDFAQKQTTPFGGYPSGGWSVQNLTIEAKSSEKQAGRMQGLPNISKETSPAKITLLNMKKREIEEKINTKKIENFQSYSEQGRKWLFNKFMNPRTYDLGKQGRSAFNRKLGLKIDEKQLTLTAQDLLFATDYLIKVEKGLRNLDDIDHLKNRRVRTSGELIQIQIGIALVRLEKAIRDKINKTTIQLNIYAPRWSSTKSIPRVLEADSSALPFETSKEFASQTPDGQKVSNYSGAAKSSTKSSAAASDKMYPFGCIPPEGGRMSVQGGRMSVQGGQMQGLMMGGRMQGQYNTTGSNPRQIKTLTVSNLINNKPFNSALREFFGTSPLSQFMDQINPLAEITHKRRLSSMGPGGVTRDTATLAIRGIHPTHYGRICPIETPEGKNTGLVNSMTAYARINPLGMLESPFYKVYKGIVLKTSGIFFLSAEQEEKTKLAASDLFVTPIGFLPNANIPVRIGENFTKINRNNVEYIGVSPIQMISIATSLIPFLEHDDANRALMGSNMQRQAVPLIRPERPIVGTGLEPRAVSDSGHVIQSKFSGVITYVSAEKIIVTTFKN